MTTQYFTERFINILAEMNSLSLMSLPGLCGCLSFLLHDIMSYHISPE